MAVLSVAHTIDNEIYERFADTWWGETTGFSTLLRTAINPVRFQYFRRILTDELGLDPTGMRALDIGCGGGLLAEEFARLGCQVTGLDPSARSLEAARNHARETGLEIDYRQGEGEKLPFPVASFDLVYCCDVLEHVRDLDAVIAETARVLKPGGIYLFDTVNRTLQSKLAFIKVYQEWDWSSFMPPNTHVWEMFIKPEELRARLDRSGIAPQPIVGMVPGINPLATLRLLRRTKRGTISYPEAGKRINMREGKDCSVMYMGYGIREGRTEAR